jgi:heptosyltransferase-2
MCYNLPVKVQDYWHPNHIKDIFLEMIKPLGVENRVRDLSFTIPEESKSRVNDFFIKHNINDIANKVVINISNNRPDTRWPVKKYKETAELISKKYKAVFIITSIPADKEDAMRLSQDMDNAVYFDEVVKIMDFAALVDESSLLICGEGGSMHIGASVNIPTVSLWGGTASVANWMHRDLKQFMIKKGAHVDSISPADVLSVIKDNALLT